MYQREKSEKLFLENLQTALVPLASPFSFHSSSPILCNIPLPPKKKASTPGVLETFVQVFSAFAKKGETQDWNFGGFESGEPMGLK